MEIYSAPCRVGGFMSIGVAAFALALVLAVVALLALRRRPMDEIPRFLWALLIVVAPVLGPVTFFIVRPESLAAERRRSI